MKKIYQSLTANKIQLAGMIAAVAFFSLFIFSFTSKQSVSEKLLGFSFDYDKNEVTIKVVTHGCTVKSDFTFKVSSGNINVVRKKKDFCKMMPDAISFTYSLKEAGLEVNKAYIIKNKFIANLNIADIP
jgi:hypothetical protein